jgi:hypothetical protein
MAESETTNDREQDNSYSAITSLNIVVFNCYATDRFPRAAPNERTRARNDATDILPQRT